MITNQHSSSRIQDPGSSIQVVGIIGEGKMGTSLFTFLLNFPFALRWICSQEADIEKLHKILAKKAKRSLKAGLIDQQEYDGLLQRTIISTDKEQLKDCDLIVEAVNEEVELKRNLFACLDKIVSASCILATNSSSINPSQLFVSERRNPMIIGLHYFYPIPMKNIVELIYTQKTSEETKSLAASFLEATGKQFISLNESNSFILNRLFLDIQNEAYRISDQGKATLSQIDQLVQSKMFSFGVFDFMDHVGIDTMLASVKNYVSNYPHKDYYQPLIKRLSQLETEGKLGKKSDEGFYPYENGIKIIPTSEKPLPVMEQKEILDYLRNIYLGAAKRFTMQSGCTINEMDHAIKEYFGVDKGPFG